jgi:N-acetyl-anhydromuramyl-L-alanine amidase AmpD
MNIIERPLKHGSNHNNPDRIVIHAMGEYIKDPEPMLAVDYLDKLGLSAHYLILPNEDIMMCRRPDQGAYHALNFNTDSIGIEYLVEGEHDYTTFKVAIKTNYVTAGQWQAGVELVKHLKSLYDINHIDRHSDLDPNRKVDPGRGFEWQKFKQQIGNA